jgi:hypothetical protein
VFSLGSSHYAGLPEIYPPFIFTSSLLVNHLSVFVNLGFCSRDSSVCIYIESFEQEPTFHNIFYFSIHLQPIFLLEFGRCSVDPLMWDGFELEIIVAPGLVWAFI